MFEEFTEDYFMDQARALGEEYGVDTRQEAYSWMLPQVTASVLQNS